MTQYCECFLVFFFFEFWDCEGLPSQGKCRRFGCAWLGKSDECQIECIRHADIALSGEKLGDYEYLARNQIECEQFCLHESKCVQYTFSDRLCSLYQSVDSEFQQHGSVTGICLEKESPTVNLSNFSYT